MPAETDTPLMRQWREVKARHPDSLVFFRVGDFYEFFYGDAEEGARILGLTLTSRNNGAAARVPLAGVPAKALDDYVGRLVRQGRRVAICEQVEDPATAKGIVRREVVETVTPGTVLQDGLLERRRNTYLVAVVPGQLHAAETRPGPGMDPTEPGNGWGLAALDLSTGELILEAVSDEALGAALGRLEPAELLLPGSVDEAPPATFRAATSELDALHTVRADWLFDAEPALTELVGRYRVQSLEGFGFTDRDGILMRAAGALVAYVGETQPAATLHLRPPRILRAGTSMSLDDMTRRNLELVAPLRPGLEGGTLLDVLDRTRTAMGARTLRRWLLHPLVDAPSIWARQAALDCLASDPDRLAKVGAALAGVGDLQRLAGKVGAGRAGARDLLAVARSLTAVPELTEALRGVESGPLDRPNPLVGWGSDTDPLADVRQRIEAAISSDAPATLQEGGVIRPGFSNELDGLRELRDGAVDFIAGLQARERERTGIASLKVGFNKVFGYYLEVTRANLERVPDDYVRKQTLSNAERYFTPELKSWEEKVFGAEQRLRELEADIFTEFRDGLRSEIPRLQATADRVAELDAVHGLARAAVEHRYVRPEVHTGFELEIERGRHPVVETMMARESFIPNDVRLDDDHRILIVTGPNMAGKSTVLRQVGLIQLMAQIGSFVPADRARLPVVDRIFTRVGASDNLVRGQSTFMVEMSETAAILNGAGPASLVLLDEVGRGTSTYDGVSIAWAVTEYLHGRTGAKTIFATHYHELTQLGDLLPAAFNMNVAVREAAEDVVFLRRLEPGGADRSYGVEVARLAGLPPEVLARARVLLQGLEGARAGGGAELGTGGKHALEPGGSEQLSLLGAPGPSHPALEELRALDTDRLSPLEALNVLARIVAGLTDSEGGS